MDQCAFYANCLESRYHCGPDGFPIGYGQYYCQKFSDDRGMFDVMHCLQLALVEDAVDAEAFAAHPGCYIDNGFCALSVGDWTVLLEIMGVETFLNWDVFKAAAETAAGCGEFYVYMVERGLF